jgi:hypothetical protein
MRYDFSLFEKYPHYTFNFSGANLYRLMKEYFATDFARLRKYVDAGRWFPAGSSMEEGDVNTPSAEAIIRQILYGMIGSAASSVKRAPSICCLTVSVFRLLCRAFWRTLA